MGSLCLGMTLPALGQVVGEEAEMARLEQRAEDAMANGDPDGAAMTIGKAALMAVLLATRKGDSPEGRLFQAAERLFRAQEQAYRALALFERAGGQLPASSGVCGSLSMANTHANTAVGLFNKMEQFIGLDDERSEQRERWHGAATEWEATIKELQTDLECTGRR